MVIVATTTCDNLYYYYYYYLYYYNKIIQKMNGRFFAGRRVEAEIFDGKQKYLKTGSKSNETDEEEATRLEKYAKWLEEQNTGTASAKTNTINVDVGSDDLGASGSSSVSN